MFFHANRFQIYICRICSALPQNCRVLFLTAWLMSTGVLKKKLLNFLSELMFPHFSKWHHNSPQNLGVVLGSVLDVFLTFSHAHFQSIRILWSLSKYAPDLLLFPGLVQQPAIWCLCLLATSVRVQLQTTAATLALWSRKGFNTVVEHWYCKNPSHTFLQCGFATTPSKKKWCICFPFSWIWASSLINLDQ